MVEHRSPKPGVGGSSPFAPANEFWWFMNAIKFFNEVKQELSKVSWLTKKEVIMSTVMVVGVVLVFSLLFVFVDFVIFNVIQFILNLGA